MPRAVVILLVTLGLSLAAPAQDHYSDTDLEIAQKLHREMLVVDTHSDVTPKIERGFDFDRRHDSGHMDIPRMREGGLDAEFFSVWMGKMEGSGRAIKTAIGRVDAVHEAVRKYPGDLELASTAADVRRIKSAGKIACLMGIEGGHIIEESLPALRVLYGLGCRYMSLTHSFHTGWADSSGTDKDLPPQSGGLTELGEEIVREMNRLGMMVDISHVSDKTFWHALRVSEAPLIASHSSVDAVFDHRRNLSDDMLRGLAKGGGVVMINFFNGYIDPDWAGHKKAWDEEHKEALGKMATKYKANRRLYWEARTKFAEKNPMPKTPLVVLAKHVEHVAKTVGWSHVGIGADWDGVSALPEGIDHCGHLPRLTALLLARGAKPEELRGFLGENLLRVMEGCEATAARLAKQ